MDQHNSITDTNAHTIAELAREANKHSEIMTLDGQLHVVHSDRLKVTALRPAGELFAPPPPRIRESVRADAKQSFIDYLKDFDPARAERDEPADDVETLSATEGRGDPHIFANLASNSFTGIIDYHSAAPSTCDHQVVLKLQFSEEWKRWTSMSGKLMGQADFARFLEENSSDISAPSGAELLEIASDLSAARKVDFRSAVRLDNGSQKFEYNESVEATSKSKSGSLEVPRMFKLHIPVYYGEPPVNVGAFLRYDINDGALKIGIEMHRPEYVRQAVFEAVALNIREQTEMRLIFGAHRSGA